MIAVVQELESGKYLIPGRKGDTGQLRQNEQRQRARKTALLMREAFSEAELRDLCMDFGMDYEDVDGATRMEKINGLVDRFYRHNTLDVFINWLSGQRPHVAWPETDL